MPAARTVTLVVVDDAGELRGQLKPFGVGTPWWQDLEPVIARHPDVVVLRLLDVTGAQEPAGGGDVRYLVQAPHPPAGLGPVPDAERLLADHPLRMPWARPGGPQSDLAWAARHITMRGAPVQVRSWNLSSIWRLPTADGECWLKCVPPFFAHEPAVLGALGPSASLPVVLAAEGNRMLLAAMPGVDGYDAGPTEYREVVTTLVGLQRRAADGALGRLRPRVPDWTAGPLATQVWSVIQRRGGGRPGLEALVDGWDGRLAAVAECGLPDTLFHGDAHPGNARIGVTPPVLFDWGDSGFGHPLLDLAVLDRYAPGLAAPVRRHWLALWEEAVPGSNAGRAWRLLRPVGTARGAAVFQRFLDGIEPSERVYHAGDVEACLAAAERLVAAERP